MSIDRSTAIIVAIVGILILTAAAASISDPTAAGDGFGAPGDWIDDPPDPDESDSGLIDRGSGEGVGSLFPSGETLCFPILFQTDFQLAVLTLLLLGSSLIYWRAGLLPMLAALTAVVPMGTAVYLAIAASCRTSSPDEFSMGVAGFLLDDGDGNETGGGALDVSTDPIMMLLILAAIGLLAIGIVVLRDDVPRRVSLVTGDDEGDAEEDRIELARIAGDVADRLTDDSFDDEGLENEIYRAWRQMTDQLDVDDPATSTPGEFAIEAIETGMSAEDVHDLTELFELVRYGDQAPTKQREQEAIALLQRIERSYGDEA